METKKEVKTFTEKQVIELLKAQIAECADTIDGDNISQYTAKRKIMSTELVKVK